jgi:hypothetical protein
MKGIIRMNHDGRKTRSEAFIEKWKHGAKTEGKIEAEACKAAGEAR